jgi:hydrogenase-4 component B
VRVEAAVHPFFRTRVAYEGGITPVFERYLYAPAIEWVLALARLGRRLQSGSLRLYLGYLLVTLVLLLAFVR